MIKNFLLCTVLLSWCLFDVCMEEEPKRELSNVAMDEEEQPKRELSNGSIDDVKFYALWRGNSETFFCLKKSTDKKKIKIKDATGRKIAILNREDGDEGSVTSFFIDGPLKLPYRTFILRLKNNDNFEQKPLEYYRTLPKVNGISVDNPEEQPFMKIYRNLADGVGSKPETLGEEKYLIEKKKKCCCSLY
jgi:hypothetical protein